jgi:hypothetical protein
MIRRWKRPSSGLVSLPPSAPKLLLLTLPPIPKRGGIVGRRLTPRGSSLFRRRKSLRPCLQEEGGPEEEVNHPSRPALDPRTSGGWGQAAPLLSFWREVLEASPLLFQAMEGYHPPFTSPLRFPAQEPSFRLLRRGRTSPSSTRR